MAKRRQKLKLQDTLPPAKPVRSISLKTPLHVQRFLGRLINEVRRGERESGEATKLAYIAGLLLRSFETLQLENRIAEIEKKIGESD